MDADKYSQRRVWVVRTGYLTDENEGGAFLRLIRKLTGAMGTVEQFAGTPLRIGFLQNLGDNGKVYVLGHGSPIRVGGLNASTMAYHLVARGGMPSGSTVRLVACNTAFSKWQFWQNSYAKQLKHALKARGCDATVVGQVGIATVTPGGSIRTDKVHSWKPHPKIRGRFVVDRHTVQAKGAGKRAY